MWVAPSVLSADFANLERDITLLNTSVCDWIHCDIMDGVFVPNLSFGIPVLQAIKKHSTKPLDVHLMIVQPERYITQFKQAGADILSVHIEASTHLHRTLQEIRQQGMKTGVAINPHTSISQLEDVLYLTDVVCMMSVNPGFGGQTFIERTYHRVTQLKEMIIQQNVSTLIEIDGGVNAQNATKLKAAGADVLVAGNFVFSSAQPLETIQELKLM